MKKIREIAAGWEPALAATIVAAIFVLAAQLGIAVGDLEGKAEAILDFISVIAPIVAGGVIRQKVRPLAKIAAGKHREEG